MAHVTLSLTEAHTLAANCLIKNACGELNANAVADTIVQAEADQCFSHRLFCMPSYVKSLQTDRANGKAKSSIEQLAPTVVRVKGDNGFAPPGLQIGHQPLVDCAKQNGIAALTYTNMFHIAALWPEVEKLAEAGLCAFAFTRLNSQ